jgi:TPR repeat protein
MQGFLAYPVLIALLFCTPASAGYAEGLDAAMRGDYATAPGEWKQLAEQGYGVTQDYRALVEWYKLSAEQGYTYAQYNLGNMYRQGQGVTRDFKPALKWYRLAAEKGHAKAQFNLGVMYANGLGVTQDNTRAYMWWDIVASQGDRKADIHRSRVEKMMTPAQIKKAQQLARDCVAKNYKDC